ncbi:hypothetical protein E3T34_01085 [Cryobacterium sp. TMT1-62]|uniref:hypothetical protein n=1 Tax=Cryobacterium sp. TMT1-62 TaxID=1259240 RepID=UPI00106BFA93|nr:hypothetical protein [Cryobacterium sp. TMT1-62]TFD36297.1 hypothetical protein E3T34_01085 [Cryobacterium sp. TMT1-62]
MRSKTLAVGLLTVGFLMTGCSSNSGDTAEEFESGPDAIQKASVVLGGEYTYDELKTATDIALMAGGESLTESTRTSVWDSILNVKKGLIEKGYPEPDSMAVLECLPNSVSDRGVELTQAVAFCSLEAAGIPESLW